MAQSSTGMDKRSSQLLAQMPAALTVLDLKGKIVFFNEYAPRILDRKPQYLGKNIREFHNDRSNGKIDGILTAYAQGSADEYAWTVERGDDTFLVRVTPLLEEDRPVGLIHIALKMPDA